MVAPNNLIRIESVTLQASLLHISPLQVELKSRLAKTLLNLQIFPENKTVTFQFLAAAVVLEGGIMKEENPEGMFQSKSEVFNLEWNDKISGKQKMKI